MDADQAFEWLGTQPEPEDFKVLRENEPTLRVFLAMTTQWNVLSGMGSGAHQGLRYEVLPTVFGLMQIPKKSRPEMFEMLRAMESAALKVLNKRK